MQALVLERRGELSLREIDLPLDVGPTDVKVALHTVGVCGSDVHYYTHGRIGPYVVEAPMVLGHEGAGTIVEVGRDVAGLRVGDRVCMEPGVPDLSSRASKLGLYNVDPSAFGPRRRCTACWRPTPSTRRRSPTACRTT